MSQITVQVEIDHGKIIPLQPERLPTTGRGMLTIEIPPGLLLPYWKPEEFPARRMSRKAGIDRGKFVVPADFNDPLPDDFWGL